MNLAQPKKHFLTDPAIGTSNDGWDNENSDLILAVGDVISPRDGRRYHVKEMLGQGTFGQVVKCYWDDTKEAVALKVIKNQTAFFHQAQVEVSVLQYLNRRGDPEDRHHLVRMLDSFVHKNHLCLAFELLSLNLYELVKHNRFKGLSLSLLRVFVTQILDALTVLREANIIHCDLKPENVLLKGMETGDIKVIDFGSACFENRTMYSYIQSRFYRSPEVLIGYPYTVSIDMWSLGCMAAELFLGLPLFPGASEHDLLVRINEMLGPLPEYILQKAQHTNKYFRVTETPTPAHEGGVMGRSQMQYILCSQQEFEALHNTPAPSGKRYFQHTKLADIIGAYPMRPGLSDSQMAREQEEREAFLDFLMGVLDLDPATRWTPWQAMQHPFVTQKPFRGPFQPPADHTPTRSMSQQIGSAPATSNYASTSPFSMSFSGAMMATSPEAHAQAHAAAMAAVSAHFSPQNLQRGLSISGAVAQGLPFPAGASEPRSAGTRRQSLPSSAQQYSHSYQPGQAAGAQYMRGGYDQVSRASASSQQSTFDQFPGYTSYGLGTAAQQQYGGGQMALSPMAGQSSLAAVLGSWQAGPPHNLQQHPVGSLEALRSTWHAPHNSLGHPGPPYQNRPGPLHTSQGSSYQQSMNPIAEQPSTSGATMSPPAQQPDYNQPNSYATYIAVPRSSHSHSHGHGHRHSSWSGHAQRQKSAEWQGPRSYGSGGLNPGWHTAGGWGEQPQQSGYLQRIQEQPMEQAGPAGQEEPSLAMPGTSDMGPGNWDPTYSDEQLLSGEQAWRENASRLSAADGGHLQRQHSHGLSSTTDPTTWLPPNAGELQWTAQQQQRSDGSKTVGWPYAPAVAAPTEPTVGDAVFDSIFNSSQALQPGNPGSIYGDPGRESADAQNALSWQPHLGGMPDSLSAFNQRSLNTYAPHRAG